MLTKNVTTTQYIPHEHGASMTFRQLGWRQLAEAEEVRSGTVLRNLKNMGGEMMRELQGITRTEVDQQAAAATQADPLSKYDQATVLRYGIVAWTYPDKVTPENIDSLDAATAKWAATHIINLGMPPIESETEQRFFGSPDSSTATPATATVALQAVGPTLIHPTNGSSA